MKSFEVDYLEKTVALLKEAFQFKKYKAMPGALAVFTGLLMLPIVLLSCPFLVVLAVLGFSFRSISSTVQYLHDLVSNEGQRVMHATQFVIYLLSWPTVFMLHGIRYALMLFIFPFYAIFSILAYIWTLGGFKFHLFAHDLEDLSIEVQGRYKALPIVFVIIGLAIMLIIPAVHGTITYIDLFKTYDEDLFLELFWQDYTAICLPIQVQIQVVFASLYSLIGFSRFPKKK